VKKAKWAEILSVRDYIIIIVVVVVVVVILSGCRIHIRGGIKKLPVILFDKQSPFILMLLIWVTEGFSFTIV